jgi:probable rRNA maturation factor
MIHGILHLDGMDHLTNDGDEPMLRLQEQILEKLSGERILPDAGHNALQSGTHEKNEGES